MEINYSKEEIIKLIEEYYRKLENRIVKVTIIPKKTLIGTYEEQGCITEIFVTEKIQIAGMEKEVRIRITREDLARIINAVLELNEYKLVDLKINDGLQSRCRGYGMNEHEHREPYFNGITVIVGKMNVQKLVKNN